MGRELHGPSPQSESCGGSVSNRDRGGDSDRITPVLDTFTGPSSAGSRAGDRDRKICTLAWSRRPQSRSRCLGRPRPVPGHRDRPQWSCPLVQAQPGGTRRPGPAGSAVESESRWRCCDNLTQSIMSHRDGQSREFDSASDSPAVESSTSLGNARAAGPPPGLAASVLRLQIST